MPAAAVPADTEIDRVGEQIAAEQLRARRSALAALAVLGTLVVQLVALGLSHASW